MNLINTTTRTQFLSTHTAWSYEETTKFLVRTFSFKNFIEAWSFMTAIALEAEKNNHHPDWQNVYNTVEVKLQTHDAKGVTEKDIHLAKFMEKEFKKYSPER